MVAASHLIGVFWAMRLFVAQATFTPPQSGSPPALYWLIAVKWLQLGPFGVAVFFLISGLVIPFSLRHHTRLTFLAARLLRIYPTFILAMALEMLLLYAASRYWRIPFDYPPRTILFNCLLISNLAGTPIIDFVSWTLSVEVKFYLLVVLLVPAIRLGKLTVVFGVALLLMGMEIALTRHAIPGAASPILDTFRNEATYIVFMLIGVLFYFHHAGLCPVRRFIVAVLAMTSIFLVTWRFGILRPEYPIVVVNYLYALILFAALYACRRRIPHNRPLAAMASISFPFYLIHATIGFTIMKFVMTVWHFDYAAALGIALIAIVLVASLLHVTVERWTIELGRRLGGRQGPQPDASTTTP